MRLILPESFPDSENAEAKASLLLESVPEDKRVAWREVIVQSGNTIGELAFANKVTSQRLRSINHLSTDLLKTILRLKFPVVFPQKDARKVLSARPVAAAPLFAASSG